MKSKGRQLLDHSAGLAEIDRLVLRRKKEGKSLNTLCRIGIVIAGQNIPVWIRASSDHGYSASALFRGAPMAEFDTIASIAFAKLSNTIKRMLINEKEKYS